MARAHVACVVLAGEYMRFRDALATREEEPFVPSTCRRHRRHIRRGRACSSSLPRHCTRRRRPRRCPASRCRCRHRRPATAAAHVARRAPPAAPATWVASIGLGFALTSGNADTSTLNLSFDVSSRAADAQRVQGRPALSARRGERRAEPEPAVAAGPRRIHAGRRPRATSSARSRGCATPSRTSSTWWPPSVGLGHKVRDTPALVLFLDAGLGLKVGEEHGTARCGRRAPSPPASASCASCPSTRSITPVAGRALDHRSASTTRSTPSRPA